jgi:ring-1,2-phenylacetyl-CoA epoxidase subunit PaaE
MCATCKAKVIEGEVSMDKNYALVTSDLEQGFVLTCQSHPTSERLVVDYDQR